MEDVHLPADFLESDAPVDIMNHRIDRDALSPVAHRFALIRDPSGAGFTLYEGPDLGGRDRRGRPGNMVWNELHVPALGLVERFYRELFGWDIMPDPSLSYRHTVHSASGDSIASILELDEQAKGPKNYWAVVFAVRSLDSALKAVNENGGSVLIQPGAGIDFAMVSDDQGAVLGLTETDRWIHRGD